MRTFNKSREYQGWSTVQTWCVALTIDNSHKLQTQVLDIVSGTEEQPMPVLTALKNFCRINSRAISAMAPWAWDEGQTLDGDVDWTELRRHYEAKLREKVKP